MDKGVIRCIEVIFVGTRPDVALLEVVALVLMCHKHPQSDVKLTLRDQQWLLNVLLDDKHV